MQADLQLLSKAVWATSLQGGLFALLQSIAMGGSIPAIVYIIPGAVIGGIAGWLVGWIVDWFQ